MTIWTLKLKSSELFFAYDDRCKRDYTNNEFVVVRVVVSDVAVVR